MAKIRLLGTGKVALVNDKDLKKVQGRKWRYDGKRIRGFNVNPKTGKRQNVFMHNVILGKKGPVVHLNGDEFDCRKENLKATKAPAKKKAAPKKPAAKKTTKKKTSKK